MFLEHSSARNNIHAICHLIRNRKLKRSHMVGRWSEILQSVLQHFRYADPRTNNMSISIDRNDSKRRVLFLNGD